MYERDMSKKRHYSNVMWPLQ